MSRASLKPNNHKLIISYTSLLTGVTKTKTLENEDPNIKYPKSIEITSLDVH